MSRFKFCNIHSTTIVMFEGLDIDVRIPRTIARTTLIILSNRPARRWKWALVSKTTLAVDVASLNNLLNSEYTSCNCATFRYCCPRLDWPRCRVRDFNAIIDALQLPSLVSRIKERKDKKWYVDRYVRFLFFFACSIRFSLDQKLKFLSV